MANGDMPRQNNEKKPLSWKDKGKEVVGKVGASVNMVDARLRAEFNHTKLPIGNGIFVVTLSIYR